MGDYCSYITDLEEDYFWGEDIYWTYDEEGNRLERINEQEVSA